MFLFNKHYLRCKMKEEVQEGTVIHQALWTAVDLCCLLIWTSNICIWSIGSNCMTMTSKNYFMYKNDLCFFLSESALCLKILCAQTFQYAVLIFLCLCFGFGLIVPWSPFVGLCNLLRSVILKLWLLFLLCCSYVWALQKETCSKMLTA